MADEGGLTVARSRRGVAAAGLLRAGGRRLAQAMLTLLAVSMFTYALVPLSPGSPATSLLQNLGERVTDEAIAAKEHELGLDKPLPVQYVRWLGGVLHGDFGRSWRSQLPVRTLIAQRIGPTLLLGMVALALGLLLSMAVALLSVRFHERLGDHALRLVTLVLTGIPAFVFGLLVLQYVVVKLHIGRVVADGSLGSVWLPAVTLSVVGVAGWSRPLRALLLDSMAAPYARTAVARGASPWRVLVVHALPNAFVPFLSLIGLGIGALVGGAPIVESVFSWPGLGSQALESVRQRDVPIIQSFVLLSTFAYVVGSLVTDLVAELLDPRRSDRREAR